MIAHQSGWDCGGQHGTETNFAPSTLFSKWRCCYTNYFCLSWSHPCVSIGFVSVVEIFIFHSVKNNLISQQQPVNSLHFQSILCEKDGRCEAVFLLHNCCMIRPTELTAWQSWIGNWRGDNLTEGVDVYYSPDLLLTICSPNYSCEFKLSGPN